MSACLNEGRLQAVADGEATPAETLHAEQCDVCRPRVLEARASLAEFARGLAAVKVPPMLAARVNVAAARAAAGRRGATTLRPVHKSPRRWLFAGGAAAAAAVVAIVFVLWPSVDPGGRLGAAEILNRSLQTLSVQGTELLRYELKIDAPATADTGSFIVEQVIDHQTGRWRFARFAADGRLLNGIAEDPAGGKREAIATLDGATYRFHFDISPDERVALWDVQRRYAEMMIRMVQASGAHVVTSEQGPDGERYVVDMPPTAGGEKLAPFELQRARVVVDASDYHVVEFSAAGAIMGEQVAAEYRLLTRDVRGGSLPEAAFSFGPSAPGTIELRGQGTRELPRDFVTLLLRELGRSRQQ